MMSSKSKKKARSEGSNEGVLDDFSLKSLFHAILSPEGRKPPVLKELYRLFDLLSSKAHWSLENAVSSHAIESVVRLDVIKLKFGGIHELSNLFFNELEKQFEQCLSTLCGNLDLGECSSFPGLYDVVEVVNWLLRCCMLLMALLAASHVDFVLEKFQILLQILTKASLLNLAENIGQKHAFAFNEFDTSSINKPLLFFKCTVIEVFVDELLTREQLRRCFKRILSTCDKRVHRSYFSQGDLGIVAEAICNHFILTFSEKRAFQDFFNNLFCSHAKELRYPPVLRVTAAASLLCNPIMISAPKYLQTHLITLVSSATDSKNSKPDHKLINCYLSIFAKSVNLYMKLMPWLQIDGYSDPSCDFGYPSFESHLPADTINKVRSLIGELDNYSNLYMHDAFSTMKSDLVSSSMRFAKECEFFYDVSFENDILTILSCLILKASESVDDTAIRQIECNNLQNVYLLTSSLKLMSVSLILAVWCLRHGDDGLRILKDFTSCKEYDFISRTISCFGELDNNFSSPLQQFLSDVMSSSHWTNSKRMFLHFSGLISLSFASGLDCLVKGSLLAVLAVLNLWVFEEGNLDGFRSIVDFQRGSVSAGSAVVKFQEVVMGQSSAIVVAAKFQKIRSRHLSVMETADNGEVFFKCMLKTGKNDFDDLLDFVEVQRSDEFPGWLSNRKKYKRKKMAVLRWKRQKRSWRMLKGKGN